MEAYYNFNNGTLHTTDNGKVNVKFKWCRFIKSVVVLDFRGV